MTSLTRAMRLCRNPSVIETEVEGHIILLDPVDFDYIEFNASGSEIWRMLGTSLNLDQIIGRLRDMFDVEFEACERDVIRLLEQLLERRLILAE